VYFYVVDNDDRLHGIVPKRRLLAADPESALEAVMSTDLVTLPAAATVKDALDAFVTHRLLALPVVGCLGRLHGIVDVTVFSDEILHLIDRRLHDDVFQLLGLDLSRAAGTASNRFPSLLWNIVAGLIAAFIVSRYEPLLNRVVVLAMFIPVVLILSERVGMQSVTLTLQYLHASHLEWRSMVHALRRELRTAIKLGSGCGAIVGGIAVAWQRSWWLASTLATTIVFGMGAAALFGIVLPALLRLLRRDPRIASGPIVLALSDLVTLLCYFNVASLFLE
jgi:magnesium transporter